MVKNEGDLHAMKPSDIFIAVFAYNRPRELDLCLSSLREHSSCPCVVFDDASETPEIAEVVSRHDLPLMVGQGGPGKHGGLYKNMNLAFQMAVDRGFKYFMSVQDDMQFVRPIDEAVLAEYATIFEGYAQLTQIDMRFIRQNSRRALEPHPTLPAYLWTKEYFQSFSDVGLFSVDRLTALGWSFTEGEKANRKAASSLGMTRVYPFTPVTMHVPFPTAFRQKELMPIRRFITPGAYKYRSMSPEDRARMDARPRKAFPIYKKYLTVEGMSFLAKLRFRMMKGGRVFH